MSYEQCKKCKRSPSVVTRHAHKGPWPERHYYIGRPGGIALREIQRGAIDATTLGNPYTLKEHGGDAMHLYKGHLYRRLKTERSTRDFLAGIPEDAVLICSCKPRPCHGDVIVAAWEWLRDMTEEIEE